MLDWVGALTAVDLPPKPRPRPVRKPGGAGLRAGELAGGDGRKPATARAEPNRRPATLKSSRASPASAPAKREPLTRTKCEALCPASKDGLRLRDAGDELARVVVQLRVDDDRAPARVQRSGHGVHVPVAHR